VYEAPTELMGGADPVYDIEGSAELPGGTTTVYEAPTELAGGTEPVYDIEGTAELPGGTTTVYEAPTELAGGTAYPLEEPGELGSADGVGYGVPVTSVLVTVG
jgi:hypothetical protein